MLYKHNTNFRKEVKIFVDCVGNAFARLEKNYTFFHYILVIKNKLCYNTNVLIAIEDCPFRVPRSLFNKVMLFQTRRRRLNGLLQGVFLRRCCVLKQLRPYNSRAAEMFSGVDNEG